jgi:peptidoglycan glycosyltransferase
MEDLLGSTQVLVAIRALRVAFTAAMAWFVIRLLYTAVRATSGKQAAVFPALKAVYAGLALLLVAVYAYQATWQMTGFMRPDFVAFMQRYSRRPQGQNPVDQQVRGRIFDRSGIPLAAADPSTPGKRLYPLRESFAHLVGYWSPHLGAAGIESADNLSLTGGSLDPLRDFDRFGRSVLNHNRVRGNDLTLTLDARLQEKAMGLMRGRGGAVVALRPSDGSILVLASSPSFDPNTLCTADFTRAGSPAFNRALQGLYPPGSTFKVLIAVVAAESGFNRRLDCPAAGYPVGDGFSIRDHEFYAYRRAHAAWQGHGTIGIEEAFAHSSNVFFAQLGVLLGGAELDAACRGLLLDRSVSIFGGSSGAIASAPCALPDLREASKRVVAQVAIGQGALAVTPLHMALLTASIAQDGILHAPRCNAAEAPRVLARTMPPAAARRVAQLMRNVVLTGTGRGAQIPGIAVAGKTGTAQTPDGADHSWFTCFAPYENPALTVTVIVEHGGFGSEAALPVARALIEQAEDLGLLAPRPPAELHAGGPDT